MTPLPIAFFSSGDAGDPPVETDEPTVETGDDGTIVLAVDGVAAPLTRADAAALRAALGEALTDRREFVHTVRTVRADGSYVVARRGADSSGNAKVFDGVDAVVRLFERLPDRFTAEDVGHTGLTGSRRHLLVRHFAEHPRFPCRIRRRRPLTAEKTGAGGRATETERAVESERVRSREKPPAGGTDSSK